MYLIEDKKSRLNGVKTNIDIYQKIVKEKNDAKHYLNKEISKIFSQIVANSLHTNAAAL